MSDLVGAIDDGSPQVRVYAISALRWMEGSETERAISTITSRFNDENEAVRLYAIGSCGGKYGPTTELAIPALTELLEDSNSTVKKAATEALERIQEVLEEKEYRDRFDQEMKKALEGEP